MEHAPVSPISSVMSEARSIDVRGEALGEQTHAHTPNILAPRTYDHGIQNGANSSDAEYPEDFARGLPPSSNVNRGASDDLARLQAPPSQAPLGATENHLAATQINAPSHKQPAYQESSEKATVRSEKEADAASVNKYSAFRLWWLEIGACLLFIIAIFAVVATLYPHQDKPLPDWCVISSRQICAVVSDLSRQKETCRSQTTHQN